MNLEGRMYMDGAMVLAMRVVLMSGYVWRHQHARTVFAGGLRTYPPG